MGSLPIAHRLEGSDDESQSSHAGGSALRACPQTLHAQKVLFPNQRGHNRWFPGHREDAHRHRAVWGVWRLRAGECGASGDRWWTQDHVFFGNNGPRGRPKGKVEGPWVCGHALRRCVGGCAVTSLETAVRAIRLSPYQAGLALPRSKRLRGAPCCRIGGQRDTGLHRPFSNRPPPNHGMHAFHAPGSPEAHVFSTQLPRWSPGTSVPTLAFRVWPPVALHRLGDIP